MFGVLDYRESPCFSSLGYLITRNVQNVPSKWPASELVVSVVKI